MWSVKKYSFRAGREKKYSTWAGQEAPRISPYATCLSPIFLNDFKRQERHFCLNDCKRLEPLQLSFVPPVVPVQQRGGQRALNVSMCHLCSPSFLMFVVLSALAIKQRTSSGCTEITCTTSLRSNNCPELCKLHVLKFQMDYL